MQRRLIIVLFLFLNAAVTFAQSDRIISAVLDREPKESGMALVRTDGIFAETVTVANKPESVWRSNHQYEPNQPWMRDITFRVTDVRFQSGKSPVVDIEAICYKEQASNLEMWADTKDGWRQVASTFGANKNGWMTLRASLENAQFAGRGTNGIDIRILSANDLAVRSVTATFADLDDKIDWKRAVKLTQITSPTDNLLIAPTDRESTFTYKIVNSAHKPLSAKYSFLLASRGGKTVGTRSGSAVIPALRGKLLVFPVNGAGLKKGVYDLKFTLGQPSSKTNYITRESYVGVVSPAKLTKAKPGEFLYGLDCVLGGVSDNPFIMAWTDWMGVDIIRNGLNSSDANVEEITRILPIFQKRGLRNQIMVDIPYDRNPQEREKRVRERAERAGQVAAKFPQSLYYELGNEPDLDFFYPGTIDEYIAGMVAVRDAIKAANPKAVVMNGGLSFAGEMGDRRSREFLNKVPWDKLDAVAYHGHGPLVTAERNAYERATRAARQAGKVGKRFIETESGVAARTREQEDMQARTAVQKLVYGQSVGMPYLLWFRLLMFEEDYGNLRTPQEPRPAVLSYRNTVEQLRGLRFQSLVATGTEGVEAYLFAGKTSRRAVVLWNLSGSAAEVPLTLAKLPVHVKNLRLSDMFGNSLPPTRTGVGDVLLSVGEEPVFLTWETTETAFVARRAARRIEAPASVAFVAGTPAKLFVTVKNPGEKVLSARLETVSGAQMRTVPALIPLTIPAHGSVRREITAATNTDTSGIVWPRSWRVFFDVPGDFDARTLTDVPETLPGLASYKTLSPDENGIMDFARAGAKITERAQAVAVAVVESPRDQTVKVGASADWWMAWSVNGVPVFDTLQSGNGGGFRITDHVFNLPLKKGRNIVTVRVLSGSQGWRLVVGEPGAVARALSPRRGDERIVLTLKDTKGNLLARESVGVKRIVPVQRATPDILSLSRGQLEQSSPDVELTNIVNLFDKEPDSSRWWKGDDDFSARAWLRADDTKFYVLVVVRDDIHESEPPVSDPNRKKDSIRVGLSRDGVHYDEYEIGGNINKMHRAEGEETGIKFKKDAEIIQASSGTAGFEVYRIAFDRKLVGDGVFSFNLLANDSDGYGRKQYAAWRGGLEGTRDPLLWQQIILPPISK